MPLITTTNATMSLNGTVGVYDIYSVDVPLESGQGIRTTFDLLAGESMDYFRDTANFAECK